MIKRLIRHGKARALVIDNSLLEAAGIDEDALFQISVRPNGGLVIQSIDNDNRALFEEDFKTLNKKYSGLMQRLADL